VIFGGNSAIFFNLDDPPKWKTGTLAKVPICSDFLPGGLDGAAFGYPDGVIELVSFEDCKAAIHQVIDPHGDTPVTAIAFCPSRQGAIAFAIGTEICFATLPQWGFGHFAVAQRYAMHMERVTILRWIVSEEITSLLSVDADCMLHIFDVPRDFLPIYQPP
jgi:hypothetical protein